jgi:hypothetical protein
VGRSLRRFRFCLGFSLNRHDDVSLHPTLRSSPSSPLSPHHHADPVVVQIRQRLPNIPSQPTFAKLLASERKASTSSSRRMTKDISSWAATATPSNDPEDESGGSEEGHDGGQDGQQKGEIDWAGLGEVLRRGRTKDRLAELRKLEGLAKKNGEPSFCLLAVQLWEV